MNDQYYTKGDKELTFSLKELVKNVTGYDVDQEIPELDLLSALKEFKSVLKTESYDWQYLPDMLKIADPPDEMKFLIRRKKEQLEKRIKYIDHTISYLESKS